METAGKNMKRKTTVLTLSAMLFALCFSVEAQQTGPSDLAGLLMLRRCQRPSDSFCF